MRFRFNVIETNLGYIEVGGAESEEEARQTLDEAYQNGYTVWGGGHIYYGEAEQIEEED